MKKVLSLVLAAGLLLAASLANADTKRLTLATGGTSGVYFPLGGAIAQVITNKSGGAISVTAQATGASGENMRLVQAGDVDFAMVQNDVADSAFNGLAPFRSKLDNVRVIGRLYPEYLHVVASKDSGVKALEDFKGKKVSVGARGSGNEVNCRQIFGFYGLDYKIQAEQKAERLGDPGKVDIAGTVDLGDQAFEQFGRNLAEHLGSHNVKDDRAHGKGDGGKHGNLVLTDIAE